MNNIFLRIILVCCALAGAGALSAQNKFSSNEAAYNLLNVPVSPAFIMLDVEPVTVEEPVSPTDFFASLRNATTSFSAFPNTYAVNFSPAWVFGGKKFSYESFASGKQVGQNIGQTGLISMGILTHQMDDTTEFTKASVGFKFSLFQGKVDTTFSRLRERKEFILQKTAEIREEYEKETQALLKENSTYQMLDSLINREAAKENPDITILQSLADARNKIENDIRDKVIAQYDDAALAEIRDSVSQMIFKRHGFFCDVSGGSGWRFLQNTVGDARLDRMGVWMTLGLQSKKNLNFIATARLMNFQDQRFISEGILVDVSDNLYLDAGARIVYRRNRFGISAEGVARNPLNNSGIETTSRLAFNLDYQIGKNQVLDFTFGKNFDDTEETGGNLIAVINFLFGFGNKRPF